LEFGRYEKRAFVKCMAKTLKMLLDDVHIAFLRDDRKAYERRNGMPPSLRITFTLECVGEPQAARLVENVQGLRKDVPLFVGKMHRVGLSKVDAFAVLPNPLITDHKREY